MILENPLILFAPWASALLTSRASFEPGHITSKFGYGTLIGALAASVSGVPRVEDLGQKIDFIADDMYLSGVLLLFVSLTGFSAFFYYIFYEAWKQAVEKSADPNLFSFLMVIVLFVGHFSFCAAIIVPQNL